MAMSRCAHAIGGLVCTILIVLSQDSFGQGFS